MTNCTARTASFKKAWGFYALIALAILNPVILWAQTSTWIVFDCNRPNPNTTADTYWDIWKLDPDANDWEQTGADCDLFGDPLTSDPGNEWDPTYSKEDKSVVFVSDKDDYPQLYKISINGGVWRKFYSISGDWADVDPCYSLDGTRIAFASNRDNRHWHIYTMTADGHDLQPITRGSHDNRSPCFSSDGNKIYFISNRDANETGDWEIYVVNSDGSGTATKAILNSSGQPLLLDYTEHDPCCSPTDADIIVFTTNVATPTYTDAGLVSEANRINFELFSYDFVTKDTNRLTQSWNEYCCDGKGNPVPELWNSSMPCFSPDGARIAWSADNWTRQSWQTRNPDGTFTNSFWKPDFDQGSSHNIWTCELDDMNNDHCYFPPSYWGYTGTSSPPTPYTYQHHKHYNPSWDYKP